MLPGLGNSEIRKLFKISEAVMVDLSGFGSEPPVRTGGHTETDFQCLAHSC